MWIVFNVYIHFSGVSTFRLIKKVFLEPFRRKKVLIRTWWNDILVVLSLTDSKNNGLSGNVQCPTVFLLVMQEKTRSCLCLWAEISLDLWRHWRVAGWFIPNWASWNNGFVVVRFSQVPNVKRIFLLFVDVKTYVS